MAQKIAEGVESVSATNAVIRCVPQVSTHQHQVQPAIPATGPPYASIDDLKNCDGLIMGSPSYFGNMSAALKHFLDKSSQLWLSGALIGKPASVFTSSSSLHGGQESVLISMMIPLLHHGMLISGIPYSEPSLFGQDSAATPYGASHVAALENSRLSDNEESACIALGKRLAGLVVKLNT
jgi:NAD(P)H dehydrogenase (quinone)